MLALACVLAPESAPAAASRPSDGDLSPRLAKLAKPAVRSAPPAKQAERLGVAKRGPGSLLREGNRVLIEVRFGRGAAAGAADLRAAGAKIVHVSTRYQAVTVAARPDQLRGLSSVPRVAGATEVLAPMVHGAEEPRPVTSAITPCFGAATSEGDEQLRAAQARSEFEVDGSGVQVGVLSDSFDLEPAETTATQDVESGDLPGEGNPCGEESPVQIVEEYEPGPEDPGADEGRAMAQIVHDLAPGANLAFATAFTGMTGFADNIRALRDEGADVIVDDVSYFAEPFFQEGPVGVAVTDVTESGVAYLSSAGNNNLIHEERDIASWEAPQYRDSSGCPASLVELSETIEEEEGPGFGLNPDHCMDFDPGGGVDGTFQITVSKGATLLIDLQWAEPWEGVASDIDAFLIGPEGEVVSGSIDDNVFGSQRPFELLAWENDTGGSTNVQLVINRFSGAEPRLKFALLQNGGGVTATEYESSIGGDVVGPTIFGHNGAEDAMSVGAIRYSELDDPERFSSRGPVTHYFGPVIGTLPAAPLGSPNVLDKPDVVATDGGANTFFGSCLLNAWRFFGTSAAAPHAAAVAALQREASPLATEAEIKEAQRNGAALVGTWAAQAVGAGMVNTVASIEELGVPPSNPGVPSEPTPPSVSCSGEEPEEPEPPEEEEDEPSSSDDSSEAGASPPAVPPPPIASPDRIAPHTFMKKRPRKVVFTPWRRGRAVFKFRSNEAGVLFYCQFDRKRWRRCGPRFVRWFLPGRHVLRVKARDAAGNVDPKPAVYRFRVRRVSKKQFARLKRASRGARHDRR